MCFRSRRIDTVILVICLMQYAIWDSFQERWKNDSQVCIEPRRSCESNSRKQMRKMGVTQAQSRNHSVKQWLLGLPNLGETNGPGEQKTGSETDIQAMLLLSQQSHSQQLQQHLWVTYTHSSWYVTSERPTVTIAGVSLLRDPHS